MNPYIGITDFTDFEQVERMSRIFNANLPPGSKRMLHVGVMMSYKTLYDIPSRWQNVFPPKERIAGIFSSDSVYNCLHYADYAPNPDIWKSLAKAISYGGSRIHALQLDMTWPDPDDVAIEVSISGMKIEVILQIGKQALEEVDNEPRKVVERLAQYEDVIHRVLLDRSVGRGIGMEAEGLIPLVYAIRERFPALGIGVAGGLGPETMCLVEPLIGLFPDLSIDAEARLRPSGSALDPVDWSMAERYLEKALQLFANN